MRCAYDPYMKEMAEFGLNRVAVLLAGILKKNNIAAACVFVRFSLSFLFLFYVIFS